MGTLGDLVTIGVVGYVGYKLLTNNFVVESLDRAEKALNDPTTYTIPGAEATTVKILGEGVFNKLTGNTKKEPDRTTDTPTGRLAALSIQANVPVEQRINSYYESKAENEQKEKLTTMFGIYTKDSTMGKILTALTKTSNYKG